MGAEMADGRFVLIGNLALGVEQRAVQVQCDKLKWFVLIHNDLLGDN